MIERFIATTIGFFLIGFGFGGLIGFRYGCDSTRKDFIEIIKKIERDEG